MNCNKEVGERLVLARKHYGFTQKQVADYLGITQGQMSKLEGGVRTLKTSLMEQLCALYNIDEDWLVYGDGDSKLNRNFHICFLK